MTHGLVEDSLKWTPVAVGIYFFVATVLFAAAWLILGPFLDGLEASIVSGLAAAILSPAVTAWLFDKFFNKED
jgi:hypothetical protein